MFTPETRYTREYTINSYDVDAKGQASLQSLCRYMQEMAVLHAEKLKLGFHDMMKENRGWVLAQMLVEVSCFPGLHEQVSITTWSNGPDGRFALRDFRISDAEGNVIGAASSTWLVVDVREKTICRLDNYFRDYNYNNIEFAIGRKPQRVKPVTDGGDQFTSQVRFSDLDINGHMTNVRYIDLALDMVPPAYRMEHDITELEMNFLKESKLGNKLTGLLNNAEKDNEFYHCLLNDDLGKPSFTARSCWR